MTTKDRLLAELLKFCADFGMSESTFGVMAMNDPSLINKMRKGRSVRLDTADRLKEFMADYRKRQKKAMQTESAAA